MTNRTFCFVVFLPMLGAMSGAMMAGDQVEAPLASSSRYAVLESFVGGTWVGALPARADGTSMTIEMHFLWNENRQGIRFDSAFIQGGQHQPYSSGMYAWNEAKKAFEICYTDAGGSLTAGLARAEGDVLSHELSVTDPSGKVENLRVHLTKSGADAFTNEIFVQNKGAWEKFVTVRYERRR